MKMWAELEWRAIQTFDSLNVSIPTLEVTVTVGLLDDLGKEFRFAPGERYAAKTGFRLTQADLDEAPVSIFQIFDLISKDSAEIHEVLIHGVEREAQHSKLQ